MHDSSAFSGTNCCGPVCASSILLARSLFDAQRFSLHDATKLCAGSCAAVGSVLVQDCFLLLVPVQNFELRFVFSCAELRAALCAFSGAKRVIPSRIKLPSQY